MQEGPIDLFCIDETELDASFPHVQFHIEGYQYPTFMRDRDKNSGENDFFFYGLTAKRNVCIRR